jgi:hypothetical protein
VRGPVAKTTMASETLLLLGPAVPSPSALPETTSGPSQLAPAGVRSTTAWRSLPIFQASSSRRRRAALPSFRRSREKPPPSWASPVELRGESVQYIVYA